MKYLCIVLYGIFACGKIQDISHDDQMLIKEIIKLSEVFHKYHFYPKKDTTNIEFQGISRYDLSVVTELIKEGIKDNNGILSMKFLILPDSLTLKYLYIIVELNIRMFQKHDDIKLLASELLSKTFDQRLLIDNYYNIIFLFVGNKNKPFSMETYDFNVETYGLKTNTEKSIFFLQCMKLCGSQINGYIKIARPANYIEALRVINKFPTFNGKNYYEFNYLDFQDFQLNINNKPQSYKHYYFNKYFNLLLNHLLALKHTDNQSQALELISSSILGRSEYYKYYDSPKTLEEILH